jgi:hypothetical protein
MDKFLHVFNQLKLNKKDINYLNRPITSSEIEAEQTVMHQTKKLPHSKRNSH